jgi:hypothetical protein
MQFPRYLHDPIGATKADFQSYRSNGRVLDLVGARAEEAIADTPVIAAQAADIALRHLPAIPRALGGPDPDFPTSRPQRREFAPAVEAVMSSVNLPIESASTLRICGFSYVARPETMPFVPNEASSTPASVSRMSAPSAPLRASSTRPCVSSEVA